VVNDENIVIKSKKITIIKKIQCNSRLRWVPRGEHSEITAGVF